MTGIGGPGWPEPQTPPPADSQFAGAIDLSGYKNREAHAHRFVIACQYVLLPDQQKAIEDSIKECLDAGQSDVTINVETPGPEQRVSMSVPICCKCGTPILTVAGQQPCPVGDNDMRVQPQMTATNLVLEQFKAAEEKEAAAE